ncbi:MAG: class I SAM-dependent methyltransferase [Actinobacteria bacterium]|nr:class I SAM-dependent methyltransferase [Actinomycetota bacterium]
MLDVGPGAGKFGVLLRDKSRTIDAIEIYLPYVGLFRLNMVYNQVYVGDVMQFPFKKKMYDLVILGDVLEHLSVSDAQSLLLTLRKNHISVLITVPFLYPHPAVYGNQWEEHKQADLTEEVFQERYPGFRLILGNEQQGVYYRGALTALPDPAP